MSKKSRNNQSSNSNRAFQAEDSTIKVARMNLAGVIITSMLTLFGIVVTALFAPVAIEYLRYIIDREPVPTIVITDLPIFHPLETPSPTHEFLVTPIIVSDTPSPISPSPVPTVAREIMTVSLSASSLEGKAPFTVNFNARETSVMFTNGEVATCGVTSFCTFTWTVLHEGKLADQITTNDGVFSYRFTKKGNYQITLYVCRSKICESSGTLITVK